MSIRKDYLLRMIEQMARVLARVRELLLAGRTAEARAELQRAARGVGLDLGLALTLAPDSLIPMLTTGGEIDQPKCALFAELLYLEWERALADGEEEYAERCAARALMLFGLAYEGTTMDEATQAKVRELEAS
jgi:hypothetical protein